MKTETQITDKELELISRSLDEDLSELERRRLNQKILSKEDGAQVWCRYHAISAVLKKQFPSQLNKNFSQQVMQVIESDGRQNAAPVQSGLHHVGSYFKQVAGLAIAASVAAISVISYQYFNQPESDAATLIVSQKSSIDQIQPSTSTSIQSLPVEFSPAQLTTQPQNLLLDSEVEENIYFQELNPYIQDHSGFGSQRFMTPYVEMIELKYIQE